MDEKQRERELEKERYREAVEDVLLQAGCTRETADDIIIYYLSQMLHTLDPSGILAVPPADMAGRLLRVYETDRNSPG